MVELRRFRYFVNLAEELHFGRAAAALGISQPPLSQQIRLLEDELGVQLFERNSRRVVLTLAGQLFLEPARQAIAQADHAVTIGRRAAQGEVGALAIGFNATAPLVPQVSAAIHRFRQAYPDVALSLSEVGTADQAAAIGEGSLDIGFMRCAARPPLADRLTASLLLRERLFVAMRSDHGFATRDSVAMADLAGEAFIAYAADRSGGFTSEAFTLIRAAGVEPRIVQSVRELSTLLGLVGAGLGIAVVSQSLCALQSAGLTYLPLLDPAAETAIWLVHRRELTTLPCRHFLSLVMDGAPEAADDQSIR
jgi:DNA-binding transcriptional LysR family regulator